jgi:catechol 2,3-dioxygenase-like lactoylglutathione lyase family enzyme
MYLHHYAIRCKDRHATARFYLEALDYAIVEEFTIYFNADQTEKAECLALKYSESGVFMPEVFISEGTPGSIVDNWVLKHGNGIHHLAHFVDDVALAMRDWKERGLATFTTDVPIESDDLIQCFTNPHPDTGIVYEFINSKTGRGFDASNVKRLMESTIKSDVPIGAP